VATRSWPARLGAAFLGSAEKPGAAAAAASAATRASRVTRRRGGRERALLGAPPGRIFPPRGGGGTGAGAAPRGAAPAESRARPPGLPPVLGGAARLPLRHVDAERRPVVAGARADQLAAPPRLDRHAPVRANPAPVVRVRRHRRPRAQAAPDPLDAVGADGPGA